MGEPLVPQLDRRAEEPPRAGLRGLRLVVVAPHAPPIGGMAVQADLLAANALRDGVDVVRVPSNPPVGAIGRVPKLGGLARLAQHRRLLRAALRRGGDVLHVHSASWTYFHRITVPALREGRAAGLRTVLRWDGGEADRFFAGAPAAIARGMACADVVVVPSGWLAEIFARRLDLSVAVVPNIVAAPQLPPRRAPHGGPLRLFAARHLERDYGIDLVLRGVRSAVDRGADVRLVIAGDGAERAALERLGNELLGDRVRFLGRVPRERVLDELETTDVVVNGSRVDNFPVALAEALAAGVPVVTTDAGGIPWIVQDGREGLVVPVDDAAAFATAIVRLAAEPALRTRLSAGATAAALDWTWDAVRLAWARHWGR